MKFVRCFLKNTGGATIITCDRMLIGQFKRHLASLMPNSVAVCVKVWCQILFHGQNWNLPLIRLLTKRITTDLGLVYALNIK